jgi:hypothetical protein
MDYIDRYKSSRGTLEAKTKFEELAKQSTVLFAKAQAVGLIKNNKDNNGTTTLPSNGKDIDSLLTSARG